MADFSSDAQVYADSVAADLLKKWSRTSTFQWAYVVLLWLGTLFFLSTAATAQSKKAVELFTQGMRLFSERKAGAAASLFEQALNESPNYLDAQLRLGQAYESISRPEQALNTYLAAIQTHPAALSASAAMSGTLATSPTRPDSAKAILRSDGVIPLGPVAAAYQGATTILLRLGRYSEAIPLLERFARNFAPQSAKSKQIQRSLATARFGQQAVQQPVAVSPRPLADQLNVGKSQYFPVLTADEQTLVFTMLKPEGDEDLMVTTRLAEGGWQTPVPLSANISTPDNEGTASLSADGRMLVFTACQNGTRQTFGGCDLYSSHKTGDVWSVPKNLGATINTRNYESQPSLSADGRTLYFISDRPGGLGNRDIWRSTLDATGNWTEPANVGAPVNTPFDEASPFLHANGQALFFASEGHVGLGSYDLFLSRYRPDSVRAGRATSGQTTTGWTQPVNLGYPINTAEAQASLFVSANGTRAYYSFEELKNGLSQKSRIYTFELPASLRDQVRPVNYLKGRIVDARTSKPLSATLDLIDLRTNQSISRVTSDAETGQYVAVIPAGGDYALYVTAPGHLFKSLSFNYSDRTSAETGMGQGVSLDAGLESISAASRETLNNLFFESGRYELSGKSLTELERLAGFLKANPTTQIEIAGHTDDQGDAATNLTLSKKRAQSVVTYLNRLGVEAARLRAVGYGKSRPAVKGTTEEARQQNRRIEWRVL